MNTSLHMNDTFSIYNSIHEELWYTDKLGLLLIFGS